ncbi:cobalamin-independent methionine synthase II family protein [Sulfuriflexus sp.]|uniref:cobalamin-independent methionine synthase II family protein n=1 Tax=Sulfuriflexus sp. TaxID=2015443 RepID=UPI0028CD4795|nr:cobalamin-independent methionine synthase II family protein [Sulfuriflexus sp.]MDT8405528.1 cobalamin-independent methionine synthase II family protein [Sulfuriflexus sp.]
MARSTEKFLTTHVGSLPREKDLMQMMWAVEDGIPVDEQALQERVHQAVLDIVSRQRALGIDIVNDGEMSKPSYATYIKDRLNGFGGSENSYVFADLVDFPNLARRVGEDPARQHRHAPGCKGPISIKMTDDVDTDIRNMQQAAGQDMEKVFFSSASPGVTSIFFKNEYYTTHEEYVFAIAEAMKTEYEAIAAAGATLQIDCPDLAMGRHMNSSGVTLADFRKRAALHVEALNHAVANIPAEQLRMHLCWGNYGGPHHCDMNFADIIDIVMQAKPQTLLFEAANPRHAHEWALFEDYRLPEGKILCPGVVECQSNYIEHPQLIAQRIKRYADLVGRENVMAGTDCGFSIHVGQASIDPQVVWLKLQSLAEGAAIASQWCWK